MKIPASVAGLIFWAGALITTEAVTPDPGEFNACKAWSQRVFGLSGTNESSPYLRILFQDVADAITRGKSWRGTPFQLGDKTYAHGLAFNSTKHLLIHLGRPGQRFTAETGLENNDDTRRGEQIGQGSVTFHVLVRGEEVFSSNVRRRQDPPLPLNISLNGATEFEIRVKDGGDGRGWDQALWAEATVVMADGSKLRLQDLPMQSAIEGNPFGVSFQCGGRPSATLLKTWSRRVGKPATSSENGESRTNIFEDPASGLKLSIESFAFRDFPAVEWVAHLSNNAGTNSPLLENIQALEGMLPVPASGQVLLHWSKGAVASFDDFEPQRTVLKAGSKLRLQPGGGRSSSQVLPFFNLEGATGGVIAAIGWTGEWAADFNADSESQVTMKAGLDRTHLVLHAGESIRTPRMLLLFYEGDRWRGQNLLRQFILAHHRPSRSGRPLLSPITCGNWGATAAAVHLDNIEQIIRHNLPVEYYWIDAEWFGRGGWPVNVGNWQLKQDLYPAGFKPLSAALRKTSRELMLWFEPERVYRGTRWHKEHPEWLLGSGGENFLWNLGNPEARKFLTDFVSSKVDEFGLGCYRQDFNIDPLPFWRAADSPDRQGMNEIRYIEGLYAFWDELRQRHRDLIIDNCASGGRRIDLETLGRATPFWRTDGPRDAIAHQCHTYGLLAWVPLSATSQDRARDDYEFRSSMCSSLCLNWWVSGDAPAEKIPADFPYDWAKSTLEQYLKLRDFYYGDYYPLTSYSQARDAWMAYQLNRPDLGTGLLVLLRRPESPYETARLPLKGLQAETFYQVHDLDSGRAEEHSGSELLAEGLQVRVAGKPGSTLLFYRRK